MQLPPNPPRAIPQGSTATCSQCGLAVRKDAASCKHCGVQFVGTTGKPLKERRGGISLKTIGLMTLGVTVVICGLLASVGGGQSPATRPSATELPVAAAVAAEEPTVAEAPTVDSVAATMEAAAQVAVPPTAPPAPTSAPAAKSDAISREQLGDKWPLSVDQGVFRCDGLAVMFVADDTIYALNGIARGQMERNGWSDIREIWLDNPSVDGLKIDISPLLNAGLKYCQG